MCRAPADTAISAFMGAFQAIDRDGNEPRYRGMISPIRSGCCRLPGCCREGVRPGVHCMAGVSSARGGPAVRRAGAKARPQDGRFGSAAARRAVPGVANAPCGAALWCGQFGPRAAPHARHKERTRSAPQTLRPRHRSRLPRRRGGVGRLRHGGGARRSPHLRRPVRHRRRRRPARRARLRPAVGARRRHFDGLPDRDQLLGPRRHGPRDLGRPLPVRQLHRGAGRLPGDRPAAAIGHLRPA
ncbi:hypothetical protein SBRY_70326 [Actinacidiphila bryophytorum]|uniref:Uncharacterized protein n=1 Tax=Actinacidiphila bryophytorum TaxID=1436133 RepID=A0A9W4H7J2_9ACTN|nr:hypothetical protein SBRY_70326 [Actinacidiphila bryophytorum]